MSQPASSPRPARPAYTRRATSSANFTNQLKHLQLNGSPSPPSEETITGPDGKPIKIKNTHENFSLPSDSSTLIPSSATLNLVATLSYISGLPVHPDNATTSAVNPDGSDAPAPERLDLLYGKGVSDMAIYSFIEMMKAITIPWKPAKSFHKRLSDNVVEIQTSRPDSLSIEDLRRHFNIFQFERQWNVVVTLQQNDVFRAHKRLVVFDMDSTLIQHETIDELAKFVGCEKQVSEITERAMNGELDFTASLKERCKLLNGVPSGVWAELEKVVKFTDGAREVVKALRRLGYKTAVVSGGFVPLAEWVKRELGLDWAFANQLVVSEDGTHLTGELTGDIVNADRKAELLVSLATVSGIPLSQTIAVGDGANDLVMMGKAGLGVAFCAKPAVQAVAPARVNTGNLLDVLYLLGLSEEEQKALLRD